MAGAGARMRWPPPRILHCHMRRIFRFRRVPYSWHGGDPLILRHERDHFGPIWCNNVSALVSHLLSTYPYPSDLRVPAGGGRHTCACRARFRATESQSGTKMCQKCEANARLYCECGVRFRPPVGDMGQKSAVNAATMRNLQGGGTPRKRRKQNAGGVNPQKARYKMHGA